MPAQNETTISGLSYTNKDFNTIYSELLDLVKTLTNKWDPSISNESDPGVVLIKLGALLADKNNYNIDKNILELFPLSVSQYGNARKIYDIAGYSMRWYRSATTNVTITYNGTDLDGNTGIRLFPYETMVSNEDGDTVFTLIDDAIYLSNTQRTATGIFMQGVIKQYEVNGVSTIKLDNMDENYRIYFDESMIAENGIFISDAGTSTEFQNSWTRVDNLQSVALSTKCFKFGVTGDSNTCYIEFPQDIANLIGSGLNIRYIVSSGVAGNISAGVLTTLYSNDITVTTSSGDSVNVTDNLVISNPYAATTGQDPETLSEAYSNYKDTIGTFNTLITCKDYETAVNDLYDDTTRNYLASNCVVSDRTNDINNTVLVVTLSSSGNNRELIDTGMTAFDIGLYALDPMSTVVGAYYYNKSFSANSNISRIQDELSETNKCIQHDWIDTQPSDRKEYIFKNFYTLTGTVSTYYKVSAAEATEIENNIKTALYSAYNARNIDFGVEIEFDDIVSTIQNADSRIRYVMLNQPEYELRYMWSNDRVGGYESAVPLSQDKYLEILAKMVLAGNVQLFNFDTTFAYNYGQMSTQSYGTATSAIASVTTNADVSFTNASTGYTVKDNENIILYTTNLVSEIQYTAYVNYTLNGDWPDIPANSYYVIPNGQSIIFNYVDSDNVTQNVTRGPGTIIRPTFDLTKDATFSIEKSVDGQTYNFRMMSGNEGIDIMTPNQTVFTGTVSCLWFLEDGERTEGENATTTYTLFPEIPANFEAGDTQERILQNNEYFIYTNTDRNSLVILTSGTKLIRTYSGQPGQNTGAITCTNYLNTSDVITSGLSAVSENDWVQYNTAIDGGLTVQELSIVTLGSGAVFTCDIPSGTTTLRLTNNAIQVTNPKYKATSEDTSWTTLPSLISSGTPSGYDLNWYAMSRLNLNVSSTEPQALTSGQSIQVTYEGGSTATISGGDGIYILSNTELVLSGGSSVDVSALMADGTTDYVLQLYRYKAGKGVTVKYGSSGDTSPLALTGDYYMLTAEKDGDNAPIYTLNFNFVAGQKYIIPFIKSRSIAAINLSGATILNMNDGQISGTDTSVTVGGSYFLYIAPDPDVGNTESVTIQWNATNYDDEDVIQLGSILKIGTNADNSYSEDITSTIAMLNSRFGSTGSPITTANLISKMESLIGNVSFNYGYQVDSMDAIDTSVLDSANAHNVLAPKCFWDINNPFNKFTIAQMNITNSSITVASSSRN